MQYLVNNNPTPGIFAKFCLFVIAALICYVNVFPQSLVGVYVLEANLALYLMLIICNFNYNIFSADYKWLQIKVVILLLLAFGLSALIHLERPFTTDLLQFISLIFLVRLKDSVRVRILEYAVKIITFFLFGSVIEYIIGYVTDKAFVVGYFDYYGINFVETLFNTYRHLNLRYRFCGLLTEPGTMGLLAAYLIIFVPHTVKYAKTIVISFVAGVISLSLAFYVYMSVVVIYQLIKRQLKFSYFMLIVIVVTFAYMLFYDEINHSIYERVYERDEIEDVDNRTGGEVTEYFKTIYAQPDALYGKGNRTAYALQDASGSGNAGLKWRLYQYGLAGIAFYLMAMFLIYKRQRNRNVSFGVTAIFFLMAFYVGNGYANPLYILLMFTTLPPHKKIET
jgi:hypothetical protein